MLETFPMKWFRRIAAAPLVLLAWICAIGAVRIFSKNLPDSTYGEGVFAAFITAASTAGAYFLLQPDLQKLRAMSLSQVRSWAFTNPIGQATLLYLAAAAIMLAAPKVSLLPGFVAQCAYSVMSAWSAARAKRWWPSAALAVLLWILLFGALAGTAEAVTPRGFGEGGMIFLLPIEAFPVLLVISGLVRWMRRPREPAH
jgi:hypothetical protein